MSLNKKLQKQLLLLLNVPVDEANKLVDSETEMEFAIPEGLKVFDTESYQALEIQLKAAGKSGYINAGKEIAIKDLKEKLGVEYDGKDPDLFLEKAREKILAESAYAEELALVKNHVSELDSLLASHKVQLQEATQQNKLLARDAEWLMKFPAERTNSLNDEDRLLLLKSKLAVSDGDDKMAYSYKGKPVSLEGEDNPGIEEVLRYVFEQEKWLKTGMGSTRIGRGDHSHRNNNTGMPMSLKEAEVMWERSGRKAEGADFQAHVLSLKKENASFDLNG